MDGAVPDRAVESRGHEDRQRRRQSYRQRHREAIRRRDREYYRANKERILGRTKEYKRAHPEVVRACQKRYYAAHAETVRRKARDYYAANRERILRRVTEYKRAHPERGKTCGKRYYARHADKVRAELRRKYRASATVRGRARARHGAWYRRRVAADPHKYATAVVKTGARKRRIPVIIDDEAIAGMLALPCVYCGHKDGTKVNGIDRLDSAAAYEDGNCVPCCSMCNRMKMALDPITFVHRCCQVSWHSGGPGREYPEAWSTRTTSFSFGYTRSASRAGRSLEVSISDEHATQLAGGDCSYCGRPATEKGHGIDRVDSSQGYTPDNSVPACKDCNYAKWTFGCQEFLDKCKAVAARECLILEHLARLPAVPVNTCMLRKREPRPSQDSEPRPSQDSEPDISCFADLPDTQESVM